MYNKIDQPVLFPGTNFPYAAQTFTADTSDLGTACNDRMTPC